MRTKKNKSLKLYYFLFYHLEIICSVQQDLFLVSLSIYNEILRIVFFSSLSSVYVPY